MFISRDSAYIQRGEIRFLGRNWASSILPLLNRAVPWLPAPGLYDWLFVVCDGEEGSKLPMELQHPLVSDPGRGRGEISRAEQWREEGAISLPTASSVLTAHISLESRGLLCQGLQNAGYFHPDVLCHHRPGHSVLHHLPTLVACSCCGRSPQENSSGGKDEADWPSILLADAPVDCCFWSLFRVSIQK